MRYSIFLLVLLLMVHPLQISSQQYDIDNVPIQLMEWEGNVALQTGEIADVEVQDDIMYVALLEGGIEIFNISDPSKPRKIHHTQLYDYEKENKGLDDNYRGVVSAPYEVSVFGDFLTSFTYWAGEKNVFNVSDPSNPQNLGFQFDNLISMDASNQYQCTVRRHNDIDIELNVYKYNKTQPLEIASFAIEEGDCIVEDDRIYVLADDRSRRFRISNDTVTELPTFYYQLDQFSPTRELLTVSHDIYFETADDPLIGNYLYFVNFSIPSSPVTTSEYYPESISKITISNNIPFVLTETAVYSVNMTTFTSTKLFNLTENHNLNNIAISNSTVYLYNNTHLFVLSEEGLTLISNWTNSGFGMITEYKDYIITSQWDRGIQIYSSNEKFQESSLANYSIQYGNFEINDDTMYYLSDDYYDDIQILVVMNLTALPEVDLIEIPLLDRWEQFTVKDHVIYTQTNQFYSAYRIVDGEFEQISRISGADFGWMIYSDEKYLVTTRDDKINLISIEDPTSMKFVGSYQHDDYIEDLLIIDNTMIIANWEGYTIIDISNPALPTKLISSPDGEIFGKTNLNIQGLAMVKDFIIIYIVEPRFSGQAVYYLVSELNLFGVLEPLLKLTTYDDWFGNTVWSDTNLYTSYDRLMIKYKIPTLEHSETFEAGQSPTTNLNYVLLAAVVVIAAFSLRKQLKGRSP